MNTDYDEGARHVRTVDVLVEPCPERPRYTKMIGAGWSVRKWDHDCISCTFVGHYKDDDVYFCKGTRTIVIRRSDKPNEYWSMFVSIDTNELAERMNAIDKETQNKESQYQKEREALDRFKTAVEECLKLNFNVAQLQSTIEMQRDLRELRR